MEQWFLVIAEIDHRRDGRREGLGRRTETVRV